MRSFTIFRCGGRRNRRRRVSRSNGRRIRRTDRQLGHETLEDRRLLSATTENLLLGGPVVAAPHHEQQNAAPPVATYYADKNATRLPTADDLLLSIREVDLSAIGPADDTNLPNQPLQAQLLATGFEASEGFSTGFIGTQQGWSPDPDCTEQPIVSQANPAGGSQHLRIDRHAGLDLGTFIGAYSPYLGAKPAGQYAVSVDTAITNTGGADYFVYGLSNSQGAVAFAVDLDWYGNIVIYDGSEWLDSGTDWAIGAYKNLRVDLNATANTIDYYYDGSLFYTTAVWGGTSVEQVFLAGDNWNYGDVGDFDNLQIEQDSQTPPNLVPYQPTAWSDAIVVSSESGTNVDDDEWYADDTLHVDFAVLNGGGNPTDATFYVDLYVDSSLVATWSVPPPLDPLYYVYVEDYVIGNLSAGPHTIEIRADSTDAITEQNELDNILTKEIVVSDYCAIQGNAWNDLDGDAHWDTDVEPGLANWLVYLDEDMDGEWDATEPFQITAEDGSYSFHGLEAGAYTVAQQVPDGWTQTYPAIDENLALPVQQNSETTPASPQTALPAMNSDPDAPEQTDPSIDLAKNPITHYQPFAEAVVQASNTPMHAKYTSVGYASSFDLRDLGLVTPVRNQGSCGSCWSFATYGALESAILMDGGSNPDLSENHLKNYHGFDWGPCDGGNRWISQAYLSRWSGPVDEADDPYHDWDDRPSPGGPAQYYVRESLTFDTDDEIKSALTNYGALYVTMQWDSAYYNSSDATYYYDGSGYGNHAVTLVGWDDNKVVTAGPGGIGAWLCKNSWGTSFGDDGYFWIAYGDVRGANTATSFHNAAPADSFDNVYYHDEFGEVTALNSPYAVNRFTAQTLEDLVAVQFWAQADYAQYDVRIYDTFSGGSLSDLLVSVTGTSAFAGYHTVDLPTSVSLTPGNDFYVYLHLTNGGDYPQAVDYAYPGYSSASTASPGESYYSFSGTSWTDLTEFDSTANFAIKALSVNRPVPGTHMIVVDPGEIATDVHFGNHSMNHAPTDIALSNASVAEGEPVGTVVGLLTATDQDPGETFAFSLVAGEGDADNASFEILGNELRTADVFDFATQPFLSVRVRATDAAGLWLDESMIITVTADGPTVSELVPVSSGFVASFDRAVDPASLNLYDVEAGTFGAADVSVVGDNVGTIRGSLIVDGDSVAFVATAGPLPADRYTVTLHGSNGGFRDLATGLPLDGDGDGTPGGDFVSEFTIGGVTPLLQSTVAEPVVVSMPRFTRGPGQTVDVPATGEGLPLRLSRADGTEAVDLTIHYDPTLLTISGATLGSDAPAGASVTANTSVPGVVTLVFFSPEPLAAGPAVFANLIATVPATAPYGAAHVLDLSDVSINEDAIPATADDTVHVVALLGDTTGNGAYSGLDAQRVARLVVGLDSGLAAFPMIDPVLLADTTGNGELSGLDAQRIAQQVVGLEPPEIPPVPDQMLAGVGRTANENAAAVDAVLAQMAAAGSQNDAAPARDVATPPADVPQGLVDPAMRDSAVHPGRVGCNETTGEDCDNQTVGRWGTVWERENDTFALDDDFATGLEAESGCLDATTVDACFADEAIL